MHLFLWIRDVLFSLCAFLYFKEEFRQLQERCTVLKNSSRKLLAEARKKTDTEKELSDEYKEVCFCNL